MKMRFKNSTAFRLGLALVATCGALVGCQGKVDFSDSDFEPRTDLPALTDEQMAQVEGLSEKLKVFYLDLTGASWPEHAVLSPGGTAWAAACKVDIVPLENKAGTSPEDRATFERFGSLDFSGGNCPVSLKYSSSETLESGEDTLEYRALSGQSPLHALSEWKFNKSMNRKVDSLEDSYFAALTEASLKLQAGAKEITYTAKERAQNKLLDSDLNLTINFPDFTAEIIRKSRVELGRDGELTPTSLKMSVFVNGVEMDTQRGLVFADRAVHFSTVALAPYLASSDNR